MAAIAVCKTNAYGNAQMAKNKFDIKAKADKGLYDGLVTTYGDKVKGSMKAATPAAEAGSQLPRCRMANSSWSSATCTCRTA